MNPSSPQAAKSAESATARTGPSPAGAITSEARAPKELGVLAIPGVPPVFQSSRSCVPSGDSPSTYAEVAPSRPRNRRLVSPPRARSYNPDAVVQTSRPSRVGKTGDPPPKSAVVVESGSGIANCTIRAGAGLRSDQPNPAPASAATI